MRNNQPVIATVPTAMRLAFLAVPVQGSPAGTLKRVANAAKRGSGLIRRRRMWNKTFSDGPRPKGAPRWRP